MCISNRILRYIPTDQVATQINSITQSITTHVNPPRITLSNSNAYSDAMEDIGIQLGLICSLITNSEQASFIVPNSNQFFSRKIACLYRQLACIGVARGFSLYNGYCPLWNAKGLFQQAIERGDILPFFQEIYKIHQREENAPQDHAFVQNEYYLLGRGQSDDSIDKLIPDPLVGFARSLEQEIVINIPLRTTTALIIQSSELWKYAAIFDILLCVHKPDQKQVDNLLLVYPNSFPGE